MAEREPSYMIKELLKQAGRLSPFQRKFITDLAARPDSEGYDLKEASYVEVLYNAFVGE